MRPTLKRVYEPATDDDGYRVLVDRLWPRGLTKDAARVDLWLKDVAPSPDLRRRWHGAADRVASFEEFAGLYRTELGEGIGLAAIVRLRELIAGHPQVTLVYAAKDESHNHVTVLLEVLASLAV